MFVLYFYCVIVFGVWLWWNVEIDFCWWGYVIVDMIFVSMCYFLIVIVLCWCYSLFEVYVLGFVVWGVGVC